MNLELNYTRNDHEVFSEIYTTYFGALCAYAYRFFSDKDEASEIVQDVMARIWEKKDFLNHVDSIRNYLYRSVYNHCLNKLEHLKVHAKYADYQRIRLMEIELEDYEETYPTEDLRAAIRKEIDNLPPKAKTVFEMRYIDNMRYKEIAEKLGISERTVETHIQSSVKVLRDRLKKFIIIITVILAAWLSYHN